MKKRALKDEMIDWCSSSPLSVRADLTMKKARWKKNNNGEVYGWVRVNEDIARKNSKIWLDRVNKRVYGNAYRRYGKKLNVVTVIEKNKDNKRLHIHALIECPDWMPKSDLIDIVDKSWDRSPWSYDERRIEEIESVRGSLEYNMKTGLDAVDIENTELIRAD